MSLLVSSGSTGKTVRRGALLRSLRPGMCCLAAFVQGPVLAALPKPVPVVLVVSVVPVAQESSPAEGAVFVDAAMKAKSTRRSGFAPYKSLEATLGKTVFPHSLMTEVGGVKASDTLSVLTIKTDGKYERFLATVGRSDEEARGGPAYACFEVWGDGTCFFRSTPIRSAATMVTTPAGAAVRKTPQEVNIVVRGTRTLQLVTRYASAIDQQAPDVMRAHGCVWGDPRLLTAAARETATAEPTVPIVPIPVPAAPTAKTPLVRVPVTPPPSKKSPQTSLAADPRRDSVRMAVLLLASGVGSALSPDSPPLPPHYPIKVALLPLRPALPAVGSGRRGRKPTSSGDLQPVDTLLQKLLEISLPTARRGKESLFALQGPDSTASLTHLLPSSLLVGITEPTKADILLLASFCRARQIEAVLISTLLPGSGNTGRGGSRLDLRLFDAATGDLMAHSVQIIFPSNRN